MMRKRSEKGFTLVEVLVSMAIFSFGFLAIIKMQMLATTINVQARGMTEGVIVAQNKIEELMALPYDGLVTGADGPIQGGYTVVWTVENNIPFTDTKTVEVTVEWQRKGVSQDFSIDATRTKDFI